MPSAAVQGQRYLAHGIDRRLVDKREQMIVAGEEEAPAWIL